MRREFIYMTTVRRSWALMGVNDDDLKQLEQALLENPQKGDVIEGTGGARKLRIQLGNRGKSSGGRIIYLDIYETSHLYLLFAYPKNVQSDLSSEQRQLIRKMINEIKKGESTWTTS